MPIAKEQVTVVIPTLNEEGAIGQVLDDLGKVGFGSIVVIDGYSTDRTQAIVRSIGIQLLMQNGPGKAGAIKMAIAQVTTPYMLVMDGDGTYSPQDAERLLQSEEFDEVIGARTNGRHNIPIVNRLGNYLLSKLFQLLFLSPITDVCSGMYLLRTDFAKALDIASTSFDVEVEIAGQVASRGRITQVPITYEKRIGNKKLRSYGDGTRILRTLIKMAAFYNAGLFFGTIAAFAAIPGTALLLFAVYQELASDTLLAWHLVFGVILLLIGLQGGSLALMSVLFKRSEHRIIEEIRR
jgi:dolichol-phosphate mannosyltransferase